MLRLICNLFLAGLILMMSACYDPEHFSVPGPYQDVNNILDPDTVPYIFTGENMVYLIQDGVADYSKLSLLGFTDFDPEIEKERSSWDTYTDVYGKKCLRCRQHRNFYPADDKDHFGGNKYSFEFNELASRVFLENGNNKKWRVHAKMALSSFGNESRAMLSFEGEKGWSKRTAIGFDFVNYFIAYRDESLLTGWYNPQTHKVEYRYTYNMLPCADFIAPGEAFDFDLQRVDNMFYLIVNGKLVWMKAISTDDPHLFPLIFRPWMNEVFFYDLSIEGDYQWWQPVCGQHQQEYASMQAPAMVAQDNELLLFAEGHKEISTLQTLDENAKRTNETDILLSRSTDAGENWSEWTLVKGGNGSVYFAPEVIQDGKRLMLFYTEDLTGRQNGNSQIEYIVSENGGKTWSQAEILNLELEGYELRTLPGKGKKLSDGTLLLPLRCRIGKRGTVAVARFDGEKWSLAEPIQGLRNESASLIERADGVVEMYLGYSGGGTHRKMVESRDGGIAWSEPVDADMPSGNGGQMSCGAVLQKEDGKLICITATGNVKASSFAGHDCSYPSQSYEAKSRKELYVYNPPMNYMMLGLSFTSQDEEGAWSPLESLWPLSKTYKDYIFKTGSIDAVILGNQVIVAAEAGVRVPYEGLVIFKKSW